MNVPEKRYYCVVQMLIHRLNGLRPDVKSFLLAIHELASEDDPLRTAFREFSGSSPDDSTQASALLYPSGELEEGAGFDPLTYVLLTAEQLQGDGSDQTFSYSGPMPSYFADGKEITRRFSCSLAFVHGIDLLPPDPNATIGEELPGCC